MEKNSSELTSAGSRAHLPITSTSLTRLGWDSSFMTLISLMTEASAIGEPKDLFRDFAISFSAKTSRVSVLRASLTSPKLPLPRVVMIAYSLMKTRPCNYKLVSYSRLTIYSRVMLCKSERLQTLNAIARIM